MPDMPKATLELTGLKAKVGAIQTLDGKSAVKFTQTGDKLQISVGGIKTSPHATVLALTTR